MTDGQKMQHPSDSIQDMFHHELGGNGFLHGDHVETQRSTGPQISLEDYKRTMLEYTQRQMSSFVDLGDSNARSGATSRSSESSGNSGRSGTSSNGILARQANGPPPTSAVVATTVTHH